MYAEMSLSSHSRSVSLLGEEEAGKLCLQSNISICCSKMCIHCPILELYFTTLHHFLAPSGSVHPLVPEKIRVCFTE